MSPPWSHGEVLLGETISRCEDPEKVPSSIDWPALAWLFDLGVCFELQIGSQVPKVNLTSIKGFTCYCTIGNIEWYVSISFWGHSTLL